jgi:thiamine transport system substrate-binding protein
VKQTIAALGALLLLATGCGSSGKSTSASSSTNSPTSIGSAKKDTTVTLLTHDAFAASKEVLADFTAQTGYKVKLVQPGDAGVVVNQAILTKDHPVADALFGVDNTFLTRALDAGIFEPYTPAAENTIETGVYTDPGHRVVPIDQGDVCLNYDLTYFSKDGHPTAPTSFADLIDPRYKNLTVVENASTSSPGFAFVLATVAANGSDTSAWHAYWRKLRANGVRVVNDWTEAYETDFTAGGGNGDRPIVVSYASSPPADVVFSSPKRESPRVGVVTSTCFLQYEFAGVLAHAKNPDGARALIDFMLSLRFQNDMPLQMYVNPVVTGAQLPPVYAKWAVVPPHAYSIDPQTIGDNRDAYIKEWTDIVIR